MRGGISWSTARRSRLILWALPLVLLVPLLSATSRSSAADLPLPAGTYCQGPQPAQPAAGPTKVLVIVGENTSKSVVDGSAAAPFLNGSVNAQCGRLDDMHAITHSSEANYHELVSGTFAPWAWCDFPPDTAATLTYPCQFAPSSHYTTPSVFSQVEAAGKRWRTYAQSMTTNCQHYDGGGYAQRHNPALYWSNSSCAASDVPLGQLSTDLAASSLPDFSLVIPDDNHNGHDTGLLDFDTFVATQLAAVQQSADYQSGNLVVMVTWDEGSAGTGFPDYQMGENCADPLQGLTKPSCRIDSWVVGRYVPATSFAPFSTLDTLLRTSETVLGLGYLGNAATASDPTAAFNLLPGVAPAVTLPVPGSTSPASTLPPSSVLPTDSVSPSTSPSASPAASPSVTPSPSPTPSPSTTPSPSASPAATVGPNLLIDPGFEALPLKWRGTNATTAVGQVPGRTGLALRIGSTTPLAAVAGANDNPISVVTVAGAKYAASCYMRGTVAGIKAHLQLIEYTKSLAKVAAWDVPAGGVAISSTGWTLVQVSATVQAGGDYLPLIPQGFALSTTSGAILVDDCSVNRVS